MHFYVCGAQSQSSENSNQNNNKINNSHKYRIKIFIPFIIIIQKWKEYYSQSSMEKKNFIFIFSSHVHRATHTNNAYVILWKWKKNLSKSEGKNWPLGVQCCRQHDKLKSFNWKIGYMMSSQAITYCIVRETFAISSTNINTTTNNAIHFYVCVCINANNKNRNNFKLIQNMCSIILNCNAILLCYCIERLNLIKVYT